MSFNNGTFETWKNWKPNYVPGCNLWLDSTDPTYQDTRWADKSQNFELYDGGYISDFSQGVDGWNPLSTNNIFTAPVSIQGKHNAMRVDISTNNVQHFILKGTGQSYLSNMTKFSASIYLNSGAANLTHTRFFAGANAVFYDQVDSSGAWYTISGYNRPSWITGLPRYAEIRFFPYGPGSSFAGDGGLTDHYYLKDVEYHFVKGNHMHNTVSSFYPTQVNNDIIFDGINDYYDSSLGVPNFTSDTQGEWFGVITCPSTHTRVHSLGFELDSSYFYFGMEPEDGSLRLTYWNFGNTKIKGNSLLTLDDTYIMNISSDGSRTRMGLNDREESIEVISGSDTGDWVSALGNANVMQKGRFTATSELYSPLIQKEELYYNRELTNKERRGVFNYLQIKHDVTYYSDTVMAVLIRMSGLILAEKAAMIKFIDSQVSSGNWNLIDEFVHYGLQDASNALTGWKLKVQDASGIPIHYPGSGFGFDGSTQYIDTDYNPSTATNLQQADAIVGVFINTIDDFSSLFEPFGIQIGSTRIRLQNTISNTINYGVNDGIQRTVSSTQLIADSLYTIERFGTINSRRIRKDGISIDTQNQDSSAPANGNIFVGATNQDSSAINFMNGIISSFLAGATIGFNHINFYDNLVILNTELAAI